MRLATRRPPSDFAAVPFLDSLGDLHSTFREEPVPKRPRFERRYPLCMAILACATVLVGGNDAVGAQATAQSAPPRRAGTDSARTSSGTLRSVDMRLAQSDSIGALGVLDSAIARDRKNGVLWNRYAQIAWGMSKTEKGPVMRPEMVRLRMRADSAFRYATAFAPDSAQYFIDLGRYALEKREE